MNPAIEPADQCVPTCAGSRKALLSQRRRSARLLVKKGSAKADAGVGQQRIDWPAADGRAQLVDPSVVAGSACTA